MLTKYPKLRFALYPMTFIGSILIVLLKLCRIILTITGIALYTTQQIIETIAFPYTLTNSITSSKSHIKHACILPLIVISSLITTLCKLALQTLQVLIDIPFAVCGKIRTAIKHAVSYMAPDFTAIFKALRPDFDPLITYRVGQEMQDALATFKAAAKERDATQKTGDKIIRFLKHSRIYRDIVRMKFTILKGLQPLVISFGSVYKKKHIIRKFNIFLCRSLKEEFIDLLHNAKYHFVREVFAYHDTETQQLVTRPNDNNTLQQIDAFCEGLIAETRNYANYSYRCVTINITLPKTDTSIKTVTVKLPAGIWQGVMKNLKDNYCLTTDNLSEVFTDEIYRVNRNISSRDGKIVTMDVTKHRVRKRTDTASTPANMLDDIGILKIHDNRQLNIILQATKPNDQTYIIAKEEMVRMVNNQNLTFNSNQTPLFQDNITHADNKPLPQNEPNALQI